MTFKQRYDEAYVWIWLPSTTKPVVAGYLASEGKTLNFNYGRSYLDREDSIPIYLPELPKKAGFIFPNPGLPIAGCLRDGAPDAWGRRVINNQIFGNNGKNIDIGATDELLYLLESSSDRIGALDFQRSPTNYIPRNTQTIPLEELLLAAESMEQNIPLTAELDQALLRGSAPGGARPKAMFEADDKKFIAKFSSTSDIYNLVKAEFLAMRLAAKTGLSVASVSLAPVAGKEVLLVERFDRIKTNGDWQRKAMVSALSIFGLDEMMARYASYAELTEIIRHRFTSPKITLHELFGRLVFNILCGNTDDHARNHAGFWDGKHLSLTPAYDICPQYRSGNEASQAMWITADNNHSSLAICMEAAPNFQLDKKTAIGIIKNQLEIILAEWQTSCDEAKLSKSERDFLMGRVFLNPFVFEGTDDFSSYATTIRRQTQG